MLLRTEATPNDHRLPGSIEPFTRGSGFVYLVVTGGGAFRLAFGSLNDRGEAGVGGGAFRLACGSLNGQKGTR
tara:strand:+ start:1086 stop:1304 length:219 start_codon:yes stop_codon:yes gene_type:complete